MPKLFSSLPEEVLMDIFFRLPVISIVQLRCVCKSWNALISHPQFTKDHLRSTHQQLQLVSSPYSCVRKILFLSVQSMFQNPSKTQRIHSYSMEANFHVIGSCNGIVCLYDIHKHVVKLWNPSIRWYSSKTLSVGIGLRSKSEKCSTERSITHHGFGYDHINDKYKLLLVEEVKEQLHRTRTKLYTFGPNNWKVIQNFPCRPTPTAWLAKFVGGTLNWIACGDGDGDEWVILSLDLATLAYDKLLLPHHNRIRDPPLLAVSRNCLCVSFFDTNEAHFVVWLMKEYGIQRSWTRLMIIPPVVRYSYTRDHHIEHLFDPLCISEDGRVLLKETGYPNVISYNPNDRLADFTTTWGCIWFDTQIYHQSLVSLPFY